MTQDSGTNIFQAMRAGLPRLRADLWQLFGFTVLFAVLLLGYVRQEAKVDAANTARQDFLVLANELRQSSDEMTRLARTYVVTRDPIYKQHYEEALGIRNGELPRPAAYNNVYWDIVLKNDRKPREVGSAISLVELMRQAGLTEAELAKLIASINASNDLARTERAAMAMADAGARIGAAPNDPARAQSILMLYEPGYLEAKARMMAEVADVSAMADRRTFANVQAAYDHATLVRYALFLFTAIVVVALWRSNHRLYATLGGSADDVYAGIVRLGRGDFSIPAHGPDNKSDSVLGWLAQTRRSLASIEAMRSEAEQRSLALTASLERTELFAGIGGWEVDLETGAIDWTVGARAMHEVDEGDANYGVYFRQEADAAPTAYHAALQALKAEGTPFSMEIPRVTAKGRQIWLQVRGKAVRRDGNIVRLVGHFQDITSRRAIDRQLAQANSELQAILDSTVEGIVTINRTGTILRTNRAMSAIFGHTAEELAGQNIRTLMPEPYRSQHDGHLARYHDTGEQKIIGISREVVGQRKDGTEFPLELTVTELESVPDTVNYIGTLRDVTARRSAEEQLRASQKMESVGQLTAGIAHDFNNLLAVIIANLGIVAEDLEGEAELSKRVRAALNAADRGAALTEHLLAFGRKQALSPKRLELREAVTRATQLLGRTLPGNVAIEVMSTAGMAATADIDEAQLENALLNLGINASDAMPGGGTLSFAVGERRVTEREATADIPPGAYAAITVKDTGQGMSAEVIAKAFDPFFTTKPVGRGTGLGLSMVYGFVRQSGGHIDIASALGRGTTVTLLFPLATGATGAQADAQTPAPRAAHAESRRVLLVEDMEDVREAIKIQLQRYGFKVSTAANAPEALAQLDDAARFDILLTDLGLPGEMDGHDLANLAEIKAPHLKIVTMTGYNSDRMRAADPQPARPSRAHLRKPFRVPDLTKALGDMPAKERP